MPATLVKISLPYLGFCCQEAINDFSSQGKDQNKSTIIIIEIYSVENHSGVIKLIETFA